MATNPDYDSQAINMSPTSQSHSIQVKDLNYSVTIEGSRGNPCGGKATPSQTRHLLKNINLIIKPCTLVAIMGTSGAGKTTLLNQISGRTTPTSGEVDLDGVKIQNVKLTGKIAYVMQDDLLMESQTVREVIAFAIALLQEKMSSSERAEKVEKTITQLGLEKVADQTVGPSLKNKRGLSGGERKRVSIAAAIVADPDVIILDEPTTGLDSYTSESVIDILKNLTNQGKTVICTLHQPSTRAFNTFDQLVLMTNGNLVYGGSVEDSVPYFDSIGYPCPKFTNPPEYFMRMLRTCGDEKVWEQTEDRLQKQDEFSQSLASQWTSRSPPNTSFRGVTNTDDTEVVTASGYASSFISQIGHISRRELRNIFRVPQNFIAQLIQTIFLGLIIGLVFIDPDDSRTGVRTKTGAFFFIAANISFMNATGAFIKVPLERSLILREHKSSYYTLFTYFMSKWIIEIPFLLFFALIYLICVYFLVNFHKTFESFALSLLIFFATAFTSTGFGTFISIVMKSPELSQIIGTMCILPLFLVGGLLTTDVPSWLTWLEKVSFVRYCFIALVQIEYGKREIDCSNSDGLSSCLKCYPSSQAIVDDFNSNRSAETSFAILIALGITLRIFAYIAIVFQAKTSTLEQ